MTAAPNVLIAGIGGASQGADHYVPSVLALCRRLAVACIVPGSEAPTTLVARASGELPAARIRLAANAASIFRRTRATRRSHRPVRRTRTTAATSAARWSDHARGREEMA